MHNDAVEDVHILPDSCRGHFVSCNNCSLFGYLNLRIKKQNYCKIQHNSSLIESII